jgi:hypothetical protein
MYGEFSLPIHIPPRFELASDLIIYRFVFQSLVIPPDANGRVQVATFSKLFRLEPLPKPKWGVCRSRAPPPAESEVGGCVQTGKT